MVQRLNGVDAGFLHMEQPEQPMNSMMLGVLEPGAPLTLDDVRRHLARRLDELPSFRWRIVEVPWGLHHPVAVRDPDFELDAHVAHRTLSGPDGGPAGDDELDAAFAALAEEHLDRSRPLWQVTLLDGLADGRQAIVLKYHHCLADGVGAVFNMSRVFSDQEFAPPGTRADAEPWSAERLPGRARLVRDALLEHLRALGPLLLLLLATLRGVLALRRRTRAATVEVPAFSGAAPWTPLNDAFTVRRSYLRARLSLDAVKRIREASGATLNDVVLAVVAGALRRYLDERGGAPDRPLLTTVPVSSERSDALIRQHGNQFWSFTTTLATDVADPWERLTAISACAREARQRLEVLGTGLMPAWLDVAPPIVAAPAVRGVLDRLRDATEDVDANVLVSNIRGPARPWSLHGRTVVEVFVDGPPSNGVGCNVVVWSYGDRLLLGILAFADALTDPAALGRAIEESCAELSRLALERGSLTQAAATAPG